jgi:serine/threonine protein kinase
MTNSGGTPLYMAPEQMPPIKKCYPYLTDIYGYGSLVADLFFDIKIKQGEGLELLKKINSKNKICTGVREILLKCL